VKTAIIVPFYNRWDLTHRCLWDLYQHIPPGDVEIVLVNDASTDLDCETGVVWWQKEVQRHPIRYKRNKKNLGFGGSMNVGAKIAIRRGMELLVFLSNDVQVTGNFVGQIQEKVKETQKSLIGGRIVDWDSGWNTVQYKGNKMIVPYCEGWLLACTNEVWSRLGGFDERYAPFDYEDVCLSTTAQYLGINLIALDSSYVKHVGGQTANYSSKRENITKRNRVRWEAKWADKWDEFWKV